MTTTAQTVGTVRDAVLALADASTFTELAAPCLTGAAALRAMRAAEAIEQAQAALGPLLAALEGDQS